MLLFVGRHLILFLLHADIPFHLTLINAPFPLAKVHGSNDCPLLMDKSRMLVLIQHLFQFIQETSGPLHLIDDSL